MDRDSDIDKAENAFAEEIDWYAAAEYFGEPDEAEGHPPAAGHTADCCGDTCSKECTCDTCPPMSDDYSGGGLASPMAVSAVPSFAHPSMTVFLEKIRIGLKTLVSPAVLSQMKFDQKYDPLTQKIMAELEMYLFSNKIHTETTKEDFPDGWFQGFKESLFPGFLKRRFPVRYNQIFKEVKTIHICPHLNYRTRDEERFHLQFLIPEGDLSRMS